MQLDVHECKVLTFMNVQRCPNDVQSQTPVPAAYRSTLLGGLLTQLSGARVTGWPAPAAGTGTWQKL
eukprot:3917296-Rhodomonas_salina.2